MAMDSHEGCGIGKPTGSMSGRRPQRTSAAAAYAAYTDDYP
jgi:hypothetical protein